MSDDRQRRYEDIAIIQFNRRGAAPPEKNKPYLIFLAGMLTVILIIAAIVAIRCGYIRIGPIYDACCAVLNFDFNF